MCVAGFLFGLMVS